MAAPLSIIIPTLNAEKPLLKLLPQLAEALTTGLIAEVIFADGGSTDATEAIAEETGAVFIPSAPGRGTQLNRGCAEAKGDWYLVIHADSQLPIGWAQMVADHLSEHRKLAACFRLKFDVSSYKARFTAFFANNRTRLFDLPYGDQGLLISSMLYQNIDGYPQIPLMEDVEIARRLKGKLRVLEGAITTSAHRYERDGWMKRGILNLKMLALYKMGRSPEALSKSYNRPNHKS